MSLDLTLTLLIVLGLIVAAYLIGSSERLMRCSREWGKISKEWADISREHERLRKREEMVSDAEYELSIEQSERPK